MTIPAHKRRASFGARVAAACLAALFACLGLGAAAASAESVAFVGPDSQLWLGDTATGAARAVTRDGSPADPYRSPSQALGGRLAVVRGDQALVMAPSGAVQQRLALPTLSAGSSFVRGAISSDGNAFAYEWTGLGCISSSSCVTVIEGGQPTTFSGYRDPRAALGDRFTLLAGGGEDVYLTTDSGLFALGLGPGPAEERRLGEVDGSGAGLLVRVWDGPGLAGRTLELAAAPDGTGGSLETRCTVGVPADASRFGLSHDGRRLAWQQGGSVWTSSVGFDGAAGPSSRCLLQPRLVGQGSEPALGDATLPPSSPDQVPPGPGAAPVPANSGPNKGITIPAGMSVSRALAAGLPLRLTCRVACAIRAEASIPPRLARRTGLGRKRTVVARAKSGRYKRGTRQIRLRFTPRAKLRLADTRTLPLRVRIHLTTKSGHISVIVTETVLRS